MKLIILFLVLTLCDTLCSQNECKVDTIKRFENIINYIEKDSIIAKIVYPYYPKIDCFDFPEFVYPDTVQSFVKPNISRVEYYLWVISDTNKRTIREQFALIDTVEKMNYMHTQKEVIKTNYIKTINCESKYEINIGFNVYGMKNAWSISLKPKKIDYGAYRSILYTFIFDENNEIKKVWTDYLQ